MKEDVDVSDKLKLTVTRINNIYHTRLYLDNSVIDEMACQNKIDIAWCCREMLRWFDKSGGMSTWAMEARKRQQSNPQGRVWYRVQLEEMK